MRQWHRKNLFNLIRISLLGYPLFCVLAPGHYPADARVVAKGDWAKDFILLQTATTANFRTGRYGRLMCSGLEYQIEHHFFPSVSHVHLHALQPVVQAWCEENGVPYRSLGWGEAIWKSFLTFVTPKPIVQDVEALRAKRQPKLESDDSTASASSDTFGVAG